MPRVHAVQNLLRWCAEHGVEIDQRLEIRVSPLDGSMGVFTTPDAVIDIGETVVCIPKSAVFSLKTCFASRDLPHDDASLELSLALLIEILRGSRSPFYGYLQSLPQELVDIAVFWGVDGDPDGVEAREWIRGTEVGKLLAGTGGQTLLNRIDAYFEETARPFLHHLNMQASLQEFHRAYSLVSSRAFLVDAYHGLSLVPVADAFNHVEDNQVHLESDYHVCITCGSLDECPHDTEGPGLGHAVPFATPATDTDICEMVSNLPIGPGIEVFNSYEKGLTNAQLLCQYGFGLDVNENNIITWSVDEILRGTSGEGEEAIVNVWAELVTVWPRHSRWDDLELVYNMPEIVDIDEDGVPRRIRPLSSQLALNADGEISHQVWLLLLTGGLPEADLEAGKALGIGQQVAQTQEQLEVGLEAGAMTAESRALLGDIAMCIVELCERRLECAHCSEKSEGWMGELLDEMPAERILTRRAIAYGLEERQVLQKCRSAWKEIYEKCSAGTERRRELGARITWRS